MPCVVNFSVCSFVVACTLSPAGGTVLSFSVTIFGVARPLGAYCAFHAARFRSLLRLCSSLESVEGPPKSKVIPPVVGVGAGGSGGAGFGGGAGPPKSKVLPPTTGAGGAGGAGFATAGFTGGVWISQAVWIWHTAPLAPMVAPRSSPLAQTAWVLGQPNSPVDRSMVGCQASDGHRSVPTAGEAAAEP